MNTQEIQEWEKEFDELLYKLVGESGFHSYIKSAHCAKIKSFISQKLKEQEERHKREMELRELALVESSIEIDDTKNTVLIDLEKYHRFIKR